MRLASDDRRDDHIDDEIGNASPPEWRASRYSESASVPDEADEFPVWIGEFPVPAKQNSLFRAEQGIVRSALELQRKWAPAPGGKRENGRRFRKFPVIFPGLHPMCETEKLGTG